VVLLLHGYLNKVSEYYPLARRLAQLDYAVVVPHDAQGIGSLAIAANWGKKATQATLQWAQGRPLAVIGHSFGGGAAMAAAKFVQGVSAFVAAHPATILSGISWAKVNGPILYTTGTLDSGTIGGGKLGATAPHWAKTAYENSMLPKALINVEGDEHYSTINAKGMEWLAITAWLGCYLEQKSQFCAWIRDEMCHPNQALAWCGHEGVVDSMQSMGMQDAVAVDMQTVGGQSQTDLEATSTDPRLGQAPPSWGEVDPNTAASTAAVGQQPVSAVAQPTAVLPEEPPGPPRRLRPEVVQV
jgi:hypothetical protein